MLDFLKKLEWKQIAIALAAVGVIGSSDPDTALISIVAMVIVAMVNLVAKATDQPVGRGWVSLLVYVVAFVLAIAANPPVFGLPTWNGDPAYLGEQLAAMVAAFGPVALAMTGSATILYNALSKLVFERIEDKLLPKG